MPASHFETPVPTPSSISSSPVVLICSRPPSVWKSGVSDNAVYEIRLDSEGRQFHEIPLDVAQLGDAESVTLDLYVDQTFVPVSVPGGSSADLRNLGVRVFYAFLEPR